MSFLFIKNRLFCVLFCVSNIIMILAVNYIVAGSLSYPYGMDIDHMIFKNINAAPDMNFSFLPAEDIVVVAETSRKDVIGLYDPSMQVYDSSTLVIMPSRFRYFAPGEYQSKHKTGIGLRSFEKYMGGGSPVFSRVAGFAKRAEEIYGIEIINVFDLDGIGTSPRVDYSQIDMAVFENLFSVDPSSIEYLYIDSPNPAVLQNVKRKLSELGYAKTRLQERKGIAASFADFFYTGGGAAVFIFYTLVFSYAALLYTSFPYFSKYTKQIRISRASGAASFSIIKLCSLSFLKLGTLLCGITGIGLSLYLRGVKYWVLSYWELIVIQLFFLAVFLLCLLLQCGMILRRISQEMR